MSLSKVFDNNQNWISKKLELSNDYFTELAKGQTPEFLYIGCSDSRVPAEDMMGLEPGEVFVHRNVANMVINMDLSVATVFMYAIDVLKVKHIVVCGHYGCGGVKAALDPTDIGGVNTWIANIRDVYRLHQTELDGINDENERYKRLVELNVQEQCINAVKTVPVQRAMQDLGLQIHGWVFDIGTGKLIDLNLDIKELTKDIFDMYRLD